MNTTNYQKLLSPSFLENYFRDLFYDVINPYPLVNKNKDTIFINSGIQPIFHRSLESRIFFNKNIFISQPVIRTQYVDYLAELYSLAFVNCTSATINGTEENHRKMINHWLELFYSLNLKPENFTSKDKTYIRDWGNYAVYGSKTFYYYDDLEIGDTTFFTSIKNKDDNSIPFETMSDLGFGLERIRWLLNKENSYYDINTNNVDILPNIKALISAIALLVVNKIKPANKEAGYRIRHFSKLIVTKYGLHITPILEKYLNECINYWTSWQKVNVDFKNCMETALKEIARNGNRFLLDSLSELGYENIQGININVERNEFVKRLISSGVKKDNIQKILS